MTIERNGRRHGMLWEPVLAGLVMLGGAVTPLEAQASFDWLSDAAHPRGMALANAGIAAGGPAEGLGLNPAGLVWGRAPGVGANRSLVLVLRRYPADINLQLTRIVLPLGRQMVGFEFLRLDYGTFAGYDNEGLQTGDYTAQDILIRAGLTRRLGRILSVGVSLGGVHSNLAEVQFNAALWSFGARLEVRPLGAQLGVVVQNQGTLYAGTESGGVPGELPTFWLVGLAKSLAYLPLTYYVAAGRNVTTGDPVWRLGGEFRLGRLLLRMGVDQGKRDYARGSASADLFSGFALGIGIRPRRRAALPTAGQRQPLDISLDGAVKLLGPLGYSTALALGLQF